MYKCLFCLFSLFVCVRFSFSLWLWLWLWLRVCMYFDLYLCSTKHLDFWSVLFLGGGGGENSITEISAIILKWFAFFSSFCHPYPLTFCRRYILQNTMPNVYYSKYAISNIWNKRLVCVCVCAFEYEMFTSKLRASNDNWKATDHHQNHQHQQNKRCVQCAVCGTRKQF